MTRLLPVSVLVAGSVAAGAQAQIRTELAFSGLSNPLAVEHSSFDAGTFVIQKGGIIQRFNGGVATTALNITSRISAANERGLLGLAFDRNGDAIVHYSNTSGNTQISRFGWNATRTALDAASEQSIIQIAQPASNHNGGTVRFGGDGMLYIGMGDGGGQGDPNRTAQNPNSLLGKMLRIDPYVDDFSGDPNRNYGIPTGNPFAGASDPLITGSDPDGAEAEIWGFGFRNPWKFSFDAASRGGNGAMFIADVGEGTSEEVSYESAGAGGRNYGWSQFEGTGGFNSGNLAFGPHTLPMLTYGRSLGQSITGGYVVRGGLIPGWEGQYVYGDFVSGRVWTASFTPNASGATLGTVTEVTSLFSSFGTIRISSIDLGPGGEMYVTDFGGRVLRVVPEPATMAAFGIGALAMLRRRRTKSQ